jgi:hypothetical protein
VVREVPVQTELQNDRNLGETNGVVTAILHPGAKLAWSGKIF